MRKMLLSAVALSLSSAAFAQSADFDPAPFIAEALSDAKTMSYRTREVDWNRIEADMRAAATGARDQVDLLAAYQLLVVGLEDGHSFVNASAEDRAAFKARHGREFDSGRVSKPRTSRFMSRRVPEARDLQLGRGKARLVTVPMIFGAGEGAIKSAQAIYDGVAGAASACGYVVDLRGNQGGNSWPMAVGVAPLLGEGWRSRELDRDGVFSTYARLEGGAAIVEDGKDKGYRLAAIQGWRPLPKLASAPVAVLIDDAVASSGEAMAVAFNGRANTRFFGEATVGAASSNQGFVIDDRVNIVVTTSMMADRNGAIYPQGLSPDQLVPFGEGSEADPEDAVVEAAKAWLSKQRACRA